jgi:hypothetical protein
MNFARRGEDTACGCQSSDASVALVSSEASAEESASAVSYANHEAADGDTGQIMQVGHFGPHGQGCQCGGHGGYGGGYGGCYSGACGGFGHGGHGRFGYGGHGAYGGAHQRGGHYGPMGGAHRTPGYPYAHHREYQGPQGPPTAQVAYPYYTTRGPRDFLLDNPPSIGR